MYIPKRYGESKIDKCPFCGKIATVANSQKIPVCLAHKDSTLGDMKCACGEILDYKESKFGVFFTCMRCGCISLRKALEVNKIVDMGEAVEPKKKRESLEDVDRETRQRRWGVGLGNETFSSPKTVAKPDESAYPSSGDKSKKKSVMVVRSDDPRFFD